MISILIASALAFLTPMTSFASQSEWERTSSLYEVPVPEHLKDVALFEINDVRVRTKNGVDQIKYDLPLELTGVSNRIRLKSNGDGTYSGPKAEGQCSADSCSLKYHDLQFDEAAVRDLFQRRGIKGVELDRRMQVFEHFSGDPAGIIFRK